MEKIFKKPLVLSLLIASFCLSFFFVVYKDSVSPPCFDSDEAAFAYNAYSILKTGADEYGTFLPVRLKSFGDYKMPLYSYFSIPFIATMGLNVASARALNVFIAVLFPIAMFLAVTEMFGIEEIGAISALLVSVSVGKGIIAREAHEALLASFLITLATYFFMRFLKKEMYKDGALFVICMFLALFAYQSSRIFGVFFFVFSLLYFYIHKKSGTARKFFIILFIVALCLFGITDLLNKPARVQNLFLTNTAGFTLKINQFIGEGGSRVFYNKVAIGVQEFLQNQIEYYSPNFLAVDGDSNYRFGYPASMPPLTMIEYFFIFVGIYYLFRKNERWKYLILGLFLFAPITAALTWNGISLTRSFFLIIVCLILASYGFYHFTMQFKQRKIFPYLLTLIIIIESFFLFYSWDFYLNHYSKRGITITSWECGYSQLGDYLKQNYNNFNTFYITQKNGEPYIFLLFYLIYSPSEYQKQAILSGPDQYGFGQVEKFDKFVFSIPPAAYQQQHVAIIGYPDDFNNIPIDQTKLKKITVGTQDIFWIYER